MSSTFNFTGDIMKKTIHISTLVDLANEVLLNSGDEATRERGAICGYIENVLHKTGNYKGFGYLSAVDMEKSRTGKSIGINGTDYPECFKGTDNTRRHYFIR